jgi:hypothetical protein
MKKGTILLTFRLRQFDVAQTKLKGQHQQPIE